jgi:CubicO group peptidase (beta-lactamase class C family)
MIDGQAYREIGVADHASNDAARMLFGIGRRDVAAFAASLPLVHVPGTHWNYNSAGVNLVTDALGRVFAPAAEPAERKARMAAVMKEELFAPLRMSSARPQFDAAGTFIGSALMYATAPDWARFGLLYLRNGMWQGQRILPEGWVDYARTKTRAENCDIYGAGWWVTPATGQGKPLPALTPNGPRDLFAAEGQEGQVIVLVPSKDLIVVRLGHLDDRIGWRPLGDWLKHLVSLFPDAPQRLRERPTATLEPCRRFLQALTTRERTHVPTGVRSDQPSTNRTCARQLTPQVSSCLLSMFDSLPSPFRCCWVCAADAVTDWNVTALGVGELALTQATNRALAR